MIERITLVTVFIPETEHRMPAFEGFGIISRRPRIQRHTRNELCSVETVSSDELPRSNRALSEVRKGR